MPSTLPVLIVNGQPVGALKKLEADSIAYDNTSSILDSTNVQNALDRLSELVSPRNFAWTAVDHSQDILKDVTVTIDDCKISLIGNLLHANLTFRVSADVSYSSWTVLNIVNITGWDPTADVSWLTTGGIVINGSSGAFLGILNIVEGKLSVVCVNSGTLSSSGRYVGSFTKVI